MTPWRLKIRWLYCKCKHSMNLHMNEKFRPFSSFISHRVGIFSDDNRKSVSNIFPPPMARANHQIYFWADLKTSTRCSCGTFCRCRLSGNVGSVRPLFGGLVRSFSALSSPGGTVKLETGNVETDWFDEVIMKNDEIGGHMLDVFSKDVSKVIEIIRRDEDDMESQLSFVISRLQVRSITGIFQVLNSQKVSGLRFFEWVCRTDPKLCRNADVSSMIISNCGRLDDYDTMVTLLNKFKSEKICLTAKAFGFLPVFGSGEASLKESVRKLVNLLKEVGGSCYGSGMSALIEMFCEIDLYEMAKFVMEITGRKTSLYNVLIRFRCRKGHLEEARDTIEEMRNKGCEPNSQTYNYLLGSFCKNGRLAEAESIFKEMQETGISLDEIAFEAFISHLCSLGDLDHASQFLDLMVEKGIEPRLTTHAAFIKALFEAGQFKKAYNYVIDSSVKYSQSSNQMFSLLARLHLQKGHLMASQNIIVDMIKKGLKPNFPIYVRTMKKLHKTGRGYLAAELKSSYVGLMSGSR